MPNQNQNTGENKMKKFIAVMIAAIMALCVFAACGGNTAEEASTGAEAAASGSDTENIIAKGKLVVGITDYAPMDYKDDNGEWTGFDAEFARAVAAKMGVEVEFVEIDWDNKFLELDAGSIDCIWNGMTITDEVKLNSDVTTAYAQNKQIVVMPADKLADYTTVESLADLSFAVEAGSAGQLAAEDNGLKFTAVTAQSDALLEVASGASDAAIIDSTMAYAMTGAGTDYADLGAGVFLTEEEYGIGCRKGSDLVAVLNGYMNDLFIDGTLAGLAEKYNIALADALALAAGGQIISDGVETASDAVDAGLEGISNVADAALEGASNVADAAAGVAADVADAALEGLSNIFG